VISQGGPNDILGACKKFKIQFICFLLNKETWQKSASYEPLRDSVAKLIAEL